MNNAKRGLGRTAIYTGVVGAMLLSTISAAGPQRAAAQGASKNLGPNNIAVAGRFLEVWSAQGNDQANVYVNGYPITPRRAEVSVTDGKTYDTQWFERARYEAHPENKAPYDVLLGLLGVDIAEGRGSIDPATNKVRNSSDQPFVGIDKPASADGKTAVWFQETKHSITGKIFEYWTKYGGLQQFGFPLSEQFQEVSATDGKTYAVQYFERNRFELHPEKAAPYEVELGLLGVQLYKRNPVASANMLQNAPSGVTSTRNYANIAVAQEPPAMNPRSDLYAYAVIDDAIDDGLINFDKDANPIPEIAYYVPTLENGGAYYVGTGGDRHLVVKYKMRGGQKWSDGQPLNSNDVVFAWRWIMTPSTIVPSKELSKKIYSVENPNANTVMFNFWSVNQGKAKLANATKDDIEYYQFLQDAIDGNVPVVDRTYWSVGGILPEHILKNIPGNETLDKHPYSREGHVGNGPYMIKTWTSGSGMTLVVNPNYTTTPNKPILQQINIKFIADSNQAIAQLKQNDPNLGVDMATSDFFGGGPDESMSAANLGPNLVVHSIPAAVWEHLDFTLENPGGYFKEKAVRQAVAYAIDREQIVQKSYAGQTKVQNSTQPSIDWESMDNPNFAKNFPEVAAKYKLPIYKYDPAKANQMLDAAGWVKGGDGYRSKGGVKLQNIELGVGSALVARKTTSEIVQANLKAVGIGVEPKTYKSPSPMNDAATCGLCLYAWVGDPNLGSFYLWTTDVLKTQNYPKYQNPEFDKLSHAFDAEFDRNKAAEYAAQAQVILMEDLPVLPLYQRANIELGKKNLVNWETSPSNNSTPLFNIGTWYFK